MMDDVIKLTFIPGAADPLGDGLTWDCPVICTIVAEADGRTVGQLRLMSVSIRIGESVKPAIGIGGVLVHEGVRGRGFARALMEAACREADKRLAPAVLYATPGLARNFYASFGFEQRGIVLQAPPAQNEWLMVRDFWTGILIETEPRHF